ncbi:hypothetical protein V6Z12_D10G283100 [Gossypium hirsutum]
MILIFMCFLPYLHSLIAKKQINTMLQSRLSSSWLNFHGKSADYILIAVTS